MSTMVDGDSFDRGFNRIRPISELLRPPTEAEFQAGIEKLFSKTEDKWDNLVERMGKYGT